MAGFRVLLKVDIVPGQEKEFERAWSQGRPAVTGHPANRGHWLCAADGDASTYYVVSDWTDEPSFRDFERSETHLSHRAQLHPFRTGGSMTTMTIVAGGTAAPAPR